MAALRSSRLATWPASIWQGPNGRRKPGATPHKAPPRVWAKSPHPRAETWHARADGWARHGRALCQLYLPEAWAVFPSTRTKPLPPKCCARCLRESVAR